VYVVEFSECFIICTSGKGGVGAADSVNVCLHVCMYVNISFLKCICRHRYIMYMFIHIYLRGRLEVRVC